MKYNKTKEKNYNYWNIEFDGYINYMISGKSNEYYKIREKVLSYLNNGDSLLDVGCASAGTLKHIKDFSKKKIKYKGVDYSNNFVKANKIKFPNDEFEEQDARYLKEKDGSYDVVLLYDVLDSLDGWEIAINEAIRVCKKMVIIIMWMDSHMKDKLEHMKKKIRSVEEFDFYPKGSHYHYFIVGEK